MESNKISSGSKMQNLGRFWLISFIIGSLSCTSDDTGYDPCKNFIRVEPVQVSFESRSWIDYSLHQTLRFVAADSSRIQFIAKSLFVPSVLLSDFNVSCPYDSNQIQKVEVPLKSLTTVFENADSTHPLRFIQLEIKTVLDTRNSSLDKLLLADVLAIWVQTRSANLRQILSYPVFDRGYTYPIECSYLFIDQLHLGSKIFNDVYYNSEQTDAPVLYLSGKKIIALIWRGKTYLANS